MGTTNKLEWTGIGDKRLNKNGCFGKIRQGP